ncbi:SprT-like domain-containing protein [Halobium salinum]|uniref:SprT-like domain-containing protein n=1 Tax=Halobium salinum TaxID=1364940 RepID=A0ABD5PBS8_9EURY|nr:SprT-like domain-containing protein [Halobium salinum]
MQPPADASREELREWARAYARTVDVDVDHDRLSWTVSTRAKRRAGVCLYDRDAEEARIRLAWRAYEAFDPETFAGVVRHELVHAWEFQRFGESSHGERFRRVAADLDAPLRCPRFTDGRLRLVCLDGDCDWAAHRHRASKTVTRPGDHRCGACGGRYEVRHVATGEGWRTADGYESARTRIGADW